MVSLEVFSATMSTFQSKIELYRQVDDTVGGQHAKEYFDNAVFPISRILICDIVGEEVLHTRLSEEGWDYFYLEDYILDNIRFFFLSARVYKLKDKHNGAVLYKSFNELYSVPLLYKWLTTLSADSFSLSSIVQEDYSFEYEV